MLYGFAHGKDAIEAAQKHFHGRGILLSGAIIRELRGISRNRGKKGLTAKLALLSIRSKKIKVDDINGPADEWIAEAAENERVYATVTNDTRLFNRLRSKGALVFKFSRDGKIK
jgi:rRNA-processing protein FCF1